MVMKQILINISLVILTILVVFLSMEFNVSKMSCDEGGTLYLGSEVPSCSEENEVVCVKGQEKVSCCMIEVKKSCCPETKDKSCASETKTIQFDFETLVESFNLNFSVGSILLFTFTLVDCFNTNYNGQTYLSDIPPPKLHKPVLSKIQAFLL